MNPRRVLLVLSFVSQSTFADSGVISRSLSEGLPPVLNAESLYREARPFSPQFPLWSDGAKKHRYIFLPPGTKIDSTDMEQWSFPVGTKLWKEFNRNGVRVETRVLVKVADGVGANSWRVGTYAWRSTQIAADLVEDGVPNALGTGHTIPPVRTCLQCHSGAKDLALGFEALQLGHPASDSGEVTLQSLLQEELLTQVPRQDFHLPGSSADQAALGYIHVNCGSCHNPSGTMPFLNLKHNLSAGTLQEQNAYRNLTRMRLVVLGAPERSRLIKLVSQRPGMPKSATDLVDEEGVAMLRAWIQESH